ncbi:carbohydrate-binding protein, partial [Rubrivirga sp.]|uniref:carbohydrate-binding protein n=1 Tax=Rubrivirga sp. TaxID=1885344 RepID=UPI003C761728
MRIALLTLAALFTLPAQAQIDLELDWARIGDRTGQLGVENGTASVESAEFSPDGSLIVSGAKRGGDLILWTAGGQEIWRRSHDNRAEIEVVTFTRDGTHVVSGGEDGFLRAWRVSDGVEVWNYSTNPNGGSEVSFDGLGLSNGGDRLAGGDEQGRLVVFDTSDPDPANWPDEPLAVVFQGPDNNATSDADINSVDWTQDDRFIVTAGRDGTVKRWEAADLNDADQGLRQTYTGFQSSIKSVRLSPDDQLVAAGGQLSPDGLVLVWDYATGQVVERIDFPLTKKIEAVEWTPNGRFLITGGNEGRSADAGLKPAYPDNGGFGPIRAFDRENGFALVLEQVTFRQEYFSFGASGDRLVVSSEDGGVRLWDVTYQGAPGQSPFGAAPVSLPGRIEAERYDRGGQGAAYNDTNAQNSGGAFRADEGVDVQATTDAGGGFNVGWIETGEWLEYTVDVAQAGLYDLDFRVASQSNGGALRVEAGGDVAQVSFPATGGWQTWTTVTASDVALEAGRQVLRVTAEDRLFNVNY